MNRSAQLMAGFAAQNASLRRRLGLPLGDPSAWLRIGETTVGVVRDIEVDKVRKAGCVSEVTSPEAVLSNETPPDRETAVAMAAASLLSSREVTEVQVDRSLPFIFASALGNLNIIPRLDFELGVVDRRAKSSDEIQYLARAQAMTENLMRRVCERIARADTDDEGYLVENGSRLTSEELRRQVSIDAMSHGFSTSHGAIIASIPHVGDCHHVGEGFLQSGQTIIVDLFPRDDSTGYWGDCTRTVVHGDVPVHVKKMHQSVVRAKMAAIEKLACGVPASEVHDASTNCLLEDGYEQSRGVITESASIQHGTGHGIGLDLHEPILLDSDPTPVLANEVFTVEPGLYGRADGGVRVEDMVVVDGDNLNKLHEGLDWS
ncbi:MAG: M24 family metallopeptidase [Planctomycetota bacterium]